MSLISTRLMSFLDDQRAAYEVIHHRRDYTAQGAAADTHTPGKEFAKAIVLEVDGRWILAVLPAHHKVSLDAVREGLGADQVRLAPEEKIRELFPDCEVGAESPFGNLYGLPVYVSPVLAEDEYITFNAGSHEDAIRMRYVEFEKLVQPRVLDFSTRM